MPTQFCLTIRFLQPYSHGRGGDGDPEWPPSPLRVFQALVAAAAARWNERILLEYAAPALRWLERQPAPTIVAAPGVRSEVKYRLYVPDNVADKVARSWSGGREASIADYRTEKDVRPTHLLGDAVHFLFPIAESDPEFETHRNTLIDAARSITHLGWGMDMVVGNATVLSEEDAAKLPGERWQPMEGASTEGLRVPIKGTLIDLENKHTAFLHRLSEAGFKPVPPLSAYRAVGYRRPTDSPRRPLAAFELWQPVEKLADLPPGKSKFRPYDSVRWTPVVAGMVRHATDTAARQAGWSAERMNAFVHGHSPDGTAQARGDDADRRLAYLPLPSLEPRRSRELHVGMIRRVLIAGPSGSSADIAWVRRALSGQELCAEGRTDPVAMLSVISETDRNVRPYVGPSVVWSTVTPVILPGYDDRQSKKAERLLRNTLEQAGFPTELCGRADLVWRPVGFRPGLDLAKRYRVAAHHERLPSYHVRITWPVPVRGPICLGAGRYYGVGLFAAEGSP